MLCNLLRRQARLALLPRISSSLSGQCQGPAVVTIQRAFSLSRARFQEEPLPAAGRPSPSGDYKEIPLEPTPEPTPEPTTDAPDSSNTGNTSVLWLGNLHFRIRAEEVRELFAPYGNVKLIHFPRDEQGLRNGRAFVEFSDSTEATRVFESAQEEPFVLRERLVRIEYAKNPPRAWIPNHEEIRPNNTIHIANYPFPGDEASLLALMSNFTDSIVKLHFMRDKQGRPTSKAFVTFRRLEHAHRALLTFQGHELGGTKLLLFYAHHRGASENPRAPRSQPQSTVFDA